MNLLNKQNDFNNFRNLLNQRIERMFIVVWPPLGENNPLAIDVSVGMVFKKKPDLLCVISTDKEDMWTPVIRYEVVPKVILSWPLYNYRMKGWMESEIKESLDMEYYEVTKAEKFKDIVSNRVQSVELICLQGVTSPFGVKLGFENDYILSTSISDGNTIETKLFNKNQNILYFEKKGAVDYQGLLPLL